MLRWKLAGLAGLLVCISTVAAADKEVKGKLVSVNADDRKIKITDNNKEVEYGLTAKDVVVTVEGKESKLGLKDKALVKGATVTLTIPGTGKLVKAITVEPTKVAATDPAPKPKDPPTKQKDPNPKPKDPPPAGDDKGVVATVVKADVAKMTLTVKVDGKTVELTIDGETKFIGPKGGDRGTGARGLKDDVLAPGAEIRYVQNKKDKTIDAIHLPTRKSQPPQ